MMLYFVTFLFLVNISLSVSTYICPNNGSLWQTQCFYFSNDFQSFMDAEASCVQAGGHLASIHDAFTNTFIAQEALKNSQPIDFWIGAHRYDGNAFIWTDYSYVVYADWHQYEPNHNYNCAAMDPIFKSWSTKNCTDKKSYVCTAPAIVDATPSLTNTPETSCEVGWLKFNGTNFCYLLDNSNPIENWERAEAFCKQQGAHLVSLHTQEEAQFVANIETQTNEPFWTGLSTNDNGKTWTWSDGTPTDYMPWLSGYPDYYINNITCVMLHADFSNHPPQPLYKNYECGYAQPYMCKKAI